MRMDRERERFRKSLEAMIRRAEARAIRQGMEGVRNEYERRDSEGS